jgi:glycosyltransferase involved in cell wall biosynthesis
MGYYRAMKSRYNFSLSVVYAVHNEARLLGKSLASIKDIADELIVVDGESSDSTVEIAKKAGARVISTTNKPIFHINKQMAMDEAKGDWVLQMDGDEEVDAEMKAHIIRILKAESLDGLDSGYWLKRKNWFLGRFLTKGGQYPDPVIRFYQRGKAHLPMKSVHEQMEVDGSVGWLEGHLLHYNSPTFADYLRKANTYTTLTAMEWEKKNVELSPGSFVQYVLWKPVITFLMLYFRHKGFMDGFAGFVFALFSGLHFPLAYIKYWEMQTQQSTPAKK